MSWNICISAVNALFLLHVKFTVVPMSLNRIQHGDQVSQKAGAEKAKMKGVPQNLFFSYLSL